MSLSRKVCVIGLGYIGLPTSAILASAGHEVIGVDVDSRVVDTVRRGEIHIVEPDLDTFVSVAVSSGLLRAQLEPEEADIFMICVPTPFHHDEMHRPNMDYVRAACISIAQYLRPGNLVILESTSPVGSTEFVRDTLTQEGVSTSEIFFAYCPERVLPGHIMRELVENDRIVGGLDDESSRRVADFYRTFVSRGEVLLTDARTAEMSKLVENSFRDVNIAFANELSMICPRVGINPRELIDLANRHPRVNILNPGPGVGGHCIAVDPWFIVSMDPDNAKVIRQARETNDAKAGWTFSRIVAEAKEFEAIHGRPAKIVALGLAFKPNIDDLRESPALAITESLISSGLIVFPVEPHLLHHESIQIWSLEDALPQADIVVLLVSHDEFREISFGDAIVLDFCGARGYSFEKSLLRS